MVSITEDQHAYILAKCSRRSPEAACKNGRKFRSDANLCVKRIDEHANAAPGNTIKRFSGRDHVANTTTSTPSTVQKRELISMRTRSWCRERPRALQARFPGNRNGYATRSLIGTALLIGALLLKKALKYLL